MKLAKECLDVAVFTAQLEPMLEFWQQEVRLPFEERLPTGPRSAQYRHSLGESVFKLNLSEELPTAPASGYRELWIARPGLVEARALEDPDGNRVRLVPPGERGVQGIALRSVARDPRAHERYYHDALGFELPEPGVLQCGTTRLFIESAPDAPSNAGIQGAGYRYLTVQVFDCAAEHAAALARGAREMLPPNQLGDVAIFSMVADPDGNWLEISQRASLTGPLA